MTVCRNPQKIEEKYNNYVRVNYLLMSGIEDTQSVMTPSPSFLHRSPQSCVSLPLVVVVVVRYVVVADF